MATALNLIGGVKLTSTQTSVTFSNIPQTYRDLYLEYAVTATASGNLVIGFNGDGTSTNYYRVALYGNGSTAASNSANDYYTGDINTNLTNGQYHIMDYSVTDKQKSSILRSNDPSNLVRIWGLRWTNTSAITSLSLTVSTGSLNVGSTFYLYGVLA